MNKTIYDIYNLSLFSKDYKKKLVFFFTRDKFNHHKIDIE